ncbi:MAG: RluA family pseudouridine synthase [Nitrospirae bacterium]|nr:RluA family pseudouridine synthase [Nitrospirota bacterium]
MEKIIYKTAGTNPPSQAADILALGTGLSKSRIKDAMVKGAVWVKRKGNMKRLRKATTVLSPHDHIEIHYDETLLSIRPPEPGLVSDQGYYSVWFKPSGLMAQGTMFGDHCSLLRLAELHFQVRRQAFLVHRLDREADGLMIIAHSKESAARFSELFQKKLITKEYRVEVLGDMGQQGKKGTIRLPLDGKEAVTDYEVISYDPQQNRSVVSAFIRTGRLHQIRRHFEMIGHPVMGDPKYGKGNKNREGMKLTAVSLRFHCPFSRQEVTFTI